MPSRTRKIDGTFYEMSEIGCSRPIENRRMALTRASGHNWLFDPHGPYLARPITPAQRKWPEVAAVPDAEYILWINSAQTRIDAKAA